VGCKTAAGDLLIGVEDFVAEGFEEHEVPENRVNRWAESGNQVRGGTSSAVRRILGFSQCGGITEA
jgi:hypothetical protein